MLIDHQSHVASYLNTCTGVRMSFSLLVSRCLLCLLLSHFVLMLTKTTHANMNYVNINNIVVLVYLLVVGLKTIHVNIHVYYVNTGICNIVTFLPNYKE